MNELELRRESARDGKCLIIANSGKGLLTVEEAPLAYCCGNLVLCGVWWLCRNEQIYPIEAKHEVNK
jgi:hypothetical protein